jgi:hypothetical protein
MKFLSLMYCGPRLLHRGRWWTYVRQVGWAPLYVESWIQREVRQ